ncbi:MAG: hypothetical protein QM747_21620 [Nocardioides sp.]
MLRLDTDPLRIDEVTDTRMLWDARHTYATPGRKLVTVVATDTAGQTDVQTFAIDVHGAQTIAASLPAQARYGDGVHLDAIGGGSDSPVTYRAAPAGVCTVDGSTLRIVGVGDCTVTFNQAGDGHLFGDAAPVERVVHALPAPLTVKAVDTARAYGAPRPTYAGGGERVAQRGHGRGPDRPGRDRTREGRRRGKPPDRRVGSHRPRLRRHLRVRTRGDPADPAHRHPGRRVQARSGLRLRRTPRASRDS